MSVATQFATQVSRALRKQGIAVLYSGNPITWEGVRVSASASGGALVMIDHDTLTREQRVAERVEAALLDAGYTVEHVGNTTTMTVTRPAAAS
jgi:hypothetical protein